MKTKKQLRISLLCIILNIAICIAHIAMLSFNMIIGSNHSNAVIGFVIVCILSSVTVYLIFGYAIKSGDCSAVVGYGSKIKYNKKFAEQYLTQVTLIIALGSLIASLLVFGALIYSDLIKKSQELTMLILIPVTLVYIIGLTGGIFFLEHKYMPLIKEK